MKIKNIFTVFIIYLVIILSCSCSKEATTDANVTFEETCDYITGSMLASSPLDLHFCLSDTLEYDRLTTEKYLGNISSTPVEENENFYSQALSLIESTDTDKLSSDNLYRYKSISSYLNNQLKLSQYDYKYEPLSVYSGEHVQLPLLLTEFEICDENDLEIYFKLLTDFQRYFEDIVKYEKAKNAAGEFMSENNLLSVIDFCNKFPTETASEHFLALSFNEKIQSLNLDDSTVKEYTDKHLSLLETEVFPAYDYLENELSNLYNEADFVSGGLCNKNKGREYYSLLINVKTGDNRNLQEIGTELEQRLTLLNENFKASIKNNPQLIQTILSADFDDTITKDELPDKAREYLEFLCGLSKDKFGNETDTFFIEYIEPHLSSYFSSAFFLLPPVDDIANPTIYINPDTRFTSFDLLTTLAHEGFPGHLQQTVTQKNDLVSRMFSCLGYCEGWATYCELYTFPAAVEYLKLGDEAQTENISSALKNYRELTLCIYALLDYNIHYNYWTPEDAATLLSDYGISDTASVTQIYDYIVSEPTSYMTYYVGYMNVLSLKKEYIASGHTEIEFHEAFMNCPEAPFDIVREKLLSGDK